MFQSLLSALALGSLLLIQGPMFRSQNYASVSTVKTLVFSDSFPYSDGDLVTNSGDNYSACNGTSAFNVSGHFLYNNLYQAVVCWQGTGTATPNQATVATFNTVGGVESGPAVRMNGTSGYMADCYSGGCRINKVVLGETTHLTSFGVSVSNGAVIEIDAKGSSSTILTLIVNGDTYQTFTDSSSPLTNGVWGLASVYGFSSSGNTGIVKIEGYNL